MPLPTHSAPARPLCGALLALCLAATAAAGAVEAAEAAGPSGGADATRVRQTQARTGRQDEAAAHVEAGVAALERGDAATARESFRRALGLDRDHVSAHTYLGLLADREGDLTGAERHFAAAAAAAPLSPQSRNNHGAVLLRLGRLSQAAAQFEISLRLDRNQPPLVNLAQIRFAAGTPEGLRQALELFERAYALAPDLDIARSLVATALRLGDRPAAARHFREYAARLADSGTVPQPSARAELGAALLEAGLTEEAVAELSAAVLADPDSLDALLALARAHLARREIPAAGRALEAAVARGRSDARLYAALAEVYEAGGYFENAIPAMRLAIAAEPGNEAYHLRYGLLLTDTKAPAAAVIRLREALGQFPRSPRLWLALGIAQLNDGKNEDAQASFARALELDADSVPALAYLGTVHAERGQLAEAVAFYERAIRADGRGAVPYYLAADALLRFAEVDGPRVEKYLTRAVEIDPDFAPARLALGRFYVRQERWDEAAKQLEQVVRLDPGLADARYQLGRVYVRLRRQADAKRELDAFQELSRTQKEKRESDRRELVRRLADVRF